MNIMFKIDGKVYTAATVGTVLPGVTRRSCIELLKDWGYEVVEGKIAIADIMAAAREGKLEEVFGTGTAAVVSPVKELVWKGEHAYIGDGKIGPVTQKLYDTMTGMQWGKIPDTKGWIVPVEQKNCSRFSGENLFIKNRSKRRQASARRRLPYIGKLLQSRIRSTAPSKREPLAKPETLPYCQSLPH